MSEAILGAYSQWLHHSSTLRWKGRVTHVVGNLVESAGPFCSVGESCEMEDSNGNRSPARLWDFAARPSFPCRWKSLRASATAITS